METKPPVTANKAAFINAIQARIPEDWRIYCTDRKVCVETNLNALVQFQHFPKLNKLRVKLRTIAPQKKLLDIEFSFQCSVMEPKAAIASMSIIYQAPEFYLTKNSTGYFLGENRYGSNRIAAYADSYWGETSGTVELKPRANSSSVHCCTIDSRLANLTGEFDKFIPTICTFLDTHVLAGAVKRALK